MDIKRIGIVISVHSRKCRVVSETDGQELSCQLRGRLFEKLKGHTKPVAVGDRVGFEVTPQGAAIEEIFPRRNSLTRPSSGKKDEIQTIAANIDCMVIVAAVKNPTLRLGLIDRFLVAAEVEEFDVVICLNKIDLLTTDEEEQILHDTTALYSGLGYTVVGASAMNGCGMDTLKEHFKRGISLIMGHSGVGKSSIINQIDPALSLKVGSISEKQKKGKHTTTSVSLLRLSSGGFVVDTPGIRAFGVNEMREGDLGHFFPEIAKRLPDCQYPNCTHRHEPGCTVLTALEDKQISRSRYKSYLSIIEDLDQR